MDMKVGFDKHSLRSNGLRRAGRFRRSAVLAAIGLCVWAAACGERAEVYFDEARQYEADYEFEKAARRYELVAIGFKRSPVHAAAAEGLARCRAEMHFNRAEELIYAGATYTAIDEITAGRRLDADNPRGLYLVGLAHRFIGPRTLALEESDDCIKKYPASPYGYLGRAEYFRFLIEREDALADYVRAFRVAGRDARPRGAAFRGIRDMTLKLGQPERAVNNYRREAKGAVRGDAFNYWVGYYYLLKKPIIYRDAQKYFDKVIAGRGPGSYKARAYAGRAECYLFYKDLERAKADVDQAIAIDAENDAFYKTAEEIYRKLSLPPPRKTQK
jgi:tetratricopeptide (TPR) repeat protein